MSVWRVEFKDRVCKREIPKLPKEVRALLSEAEDDLKNEGPFPYGWNVDKLEKRKNRMWLKYKWRIIYTYDDETICKKLFMLAPRKMFLIKTREVI